MEMVAGSRKALEKGTENTFKSAYYTIHVIDRLKRGSLIARACGCDRARIEHLEFRVADGTLVIDIAA
jgi:hypothetical protein